MITNSQCPMITHKPWPDIKQYREVIRAVKDASTFAGKDANGDAIYDPLKPLPTIKFRGTTKLHGSNGALVIASTGEVAYQTRERIATVENDNAGFARFFTDIFATGFKPSQVLGGATNASDIRIFGEWCGGSIQKGVALNQLPKMFVIFGAQIDDVWLTPEQVALIPEHPEHNIYNIYFIPAYHFEIDFNRPEIAQAEMIKLVEKIEAECPWGKRFGVTGIGEGFVATPVTPGWFSTKFIFKVKGEKHSISKVKTLAPVDVEKANSIAEFVSNVVTPARCEQSITKLRETGIKNIGREHLGTYLKWIVGDVIKEESDTAAASGIEIDKIGGALSNAAKKWFFENETSL